LRRSELIKLRLGDVRRTAKGTTFLRLRSTKGKVDSDQALPGWAAQAVNSLCLEREKQGAESGDYLFTSFTGQAGRTATNRPISATGIYQTFLQYCTLAGVKNWASPHSARATAITKLLDDGLSHREVKEFSRHAGIDMVELYDKRRVSIDENPAKGLSFGKGSKT
jgi:integrase